MTQYLVLSYDPQYLEDKHPRILYSGSDVTTAERLLKQYREAYKGYAIALAEVQMP